MIKNSKLYYVGGVVRDEFLGKASFDIDLCYEGNAIEFAKSEGLNIIRENPDFGTVRVLLEGKEVDIASTRSEKYPQKGKLPVVTNIGCSLKEDLIRRDFTINAMAKRTTDGEIIDYFNGLKDIENKSLNILHEGSFIDDPTRIVRGLKFSVRFGFELGEETRKLQDEYLQNINYDMSYHRLKKEFKETFNLNKKEAFDRFVEQKIYKLLGENQYVPEIPETVEDLASNAKNVWLIYLGGFDLSRLELTRSEKRVIEWFHKLENTPAGNNTPGDSVIMREVYSGDV